MRLFTFFEHSEAVKELGKDMSAPTQESWYKMKRLIRYLKGCPRIRIWYEYQEAPENAIVWTDSDFAGCMKSRKSTSAGVVLLGGHLVKSWSSNQAVVALSSGEAEDYAIVKGSSVGIGITALAADMGVVLEKPIEVLRCRM